MVQKRPLCDEQLCTISSKHPRQVEHGDRLVSFSEFVPLEVASVTSHVSGEDGFTETSTKEDERVAGSITTRIPFRGERDIQIAVPGSSFISSWAIGSSSEEASPPQLPVHIPFPLEYLSPERPIRTVPRYEDAYSALLRYPPRKAVRIGSNHQAHIPEWKPHGNKTSSTSETILDTYIIDGKKDEKMGTCVIPMPDLELAGDVGNARTDCNCLDKGSVRCVRQHIMEARMKLERILGQETFAGLGMRNMGEPVAEKWSEEEEQLFHEVVYSNPLSSGKNFWNSLSVVFPCRSKKDIVCYYFNVFMLQRRAEQNRCDSMAIDSDTDEWQGSDDYGGNELGMTEEDEDSVVESPLHEDYYVHNQRQKYDLDVYDEGASDDTCDNNEGTDFACGRGIAKVPETCHRKSLENYGPNPASPLLDEILCDERVEQEIQDDSCTSSDTVVSSQWTQGKAEKDNCWPTSFNEFSGGCGQEYILEPCDAKVWDTGYMTCPKSEVDLLPTCSVIEEVFGDGSRNHKARDGKNLS